jgi:hypothetical protein
LFLHHPAVARGKARVAAQWAVRFDFRSEHSNVEMHGCETCSSEMEGTQGEKKKKKNEENKNAGRRTK